MARAQQTVLRGRRKSAGRPATRRATAKPATGRRAEKGASRREAILAAAFDEFTARGFAATRLDDVARRAKVAKGTIYLYFRDKEALFQDIIRSLVSPLIAALEAAPSADQPLRVTIDHLVRIFVHEIYGTRRKDVIRLMISEGRHFPAVAEFYFHEVIERAMNSLRAVMRRARARGEIETDLFERFPQLLIAPGLVGIIWEGLFDAYEPLDVEAMMKAHIDFLFGTRRGA
jgi:AcrR family transcriptional regulator